MRRGSWVLLLACALASQARAVPRVIALGGHLYAYISDNDGSSNSTFLVGSKGILVVDTGLNSHEGGKLLRAIRAISPLPVRYIVNTHYHLDHQGGNTTVGPNATVISTAFTRRRTLAILSRPGAPPLRPATLIVHGRLMVYLGDEEAIVQSVGPAHTGGDAYVYFPSQHTVATGDLYLNGSCPAMDRGSEANWIRALDEILRLPATHFVPGHFALGDRASITEFRDYLVALRAQVFRLRRAGASAAEVRREIRLPRFAKLRQFPKFQATIADNAVTVYEQLAAGGARP